MDKLYLCAGLGGYFTVYAGSLRFAEGEARKYGGEAIRELNEEELWDYTNYTLIAER